MGAKVYPSDLTDAQWELLEPLIPPVVEGAAHVLHTRREIVNAILYVLRSGCSWRMLPRDYPRWGTVYDYFRQWQRDGTWDRVLQILHMQVRVKQGREPQPSAAIIDSQSVHVSPIRGPEKGYDAGKKRIMPQRGTIRDERGYTEEERVR